MGGACRAIRGWFYVGCPLDYIYDDPEHWKDRADEVRATAGYVRDQETKQVLLRIAEQYDKLARIAEERRAKGREPQ